MLALCITRLEWYPFNMKKKTTKQAEKEKLSIFGVLFSKQILFVKDGISLFLSEKEISKLYKIIKVDEQKISFHDDFKKYFDSTFLEYHSDKYGMLELKDGVYTPYNTELLENLCIPINTLLEPHLFDLFSVIPEFNMAIKTIRKTKGVYDAKKNKRIIMGLIKSAIKKYLKNKNDNFDIKELTKHLYKCLMIPEFEKNLNITIDGKFPNTDTQAEMKARLVFELLPTVREKQIKHFSLNDQDLKELAKFNDSTMKPEYLIHYILYENKGPCIDSFNNWNYRVFFKQYILAYLNSLPQNIEILDLKDKRIHQIINGMNKRQYSQYQSFILEILDQVFNFGKINKEYPNGNTMAGKTSCRTLALRYFSKLKKI